MPLKYLCARNDYEQQLQATTARGKYSVIIRHHICCKHDAVTNNEKKRHMNTKFVTYFVLELVSSKMIKKKTSQRNPSIKMKFLLF